MSDSTTPLRELLNRSGIPFQLAAESAIVKQGTPHGVELVGREIPWADGFVDIVARKGRLLFTFECKRVDKKPWMFVVSKHMPDLVTRCRLEWFNPRAELPTVVMQDDSRVFCCEWNMVEGSPESDFCVVPKDTPIGSLEKVCSELLRASHDLIADESIDHDQQFSIVVPVVLTNADLRLCKIDATDVPLETGQVPESSGEFIEVDLVRFRKSLVNERSNTYDSSQMLLRNWARDRERTVFVMRPSALSRFFDGFRSYGADAVGGLPEEFVNPPSLLD